MGVAQFTWSAIGISTVILTVLFAWLLQIRRRSPSIGVRLVTTLAYLQLFVWVPFVTLERIVHEHFLDQRLPVYVDFSGVQYWFAPCVATAAALLWALGRNKGTARGVARPVT